MSAFWSATVALTLAGLVGVVALAVSVGPETLKLVPIRNALLKRLVLVIQPAILLFLCALIGAATTDAAGTRSLIAEWAAGFPPAPAALTGVWRVALLGILFGFSLFLFDRLTKPYWAPPGRGPDLATDWKPSGFVAGLFYGGVTEEIMMRWGIMNLVLWLLVRVTGGADGNPSLLMVWVAVAVAALIFAAGHLPAAIAGGLRNRGFIVRTLALNFVAGLIFGWLFWSWNLETAMIAHAAFHVGGAVLALSLRATGAKPA
ncbi:MAG: CPBP family intramembrane metalloprotease [Bauldia sp.]|nr:CPBP family intramembrane metalloprotease [Bauldia sp.]